MINSQLGDEAVAGLIVAAVDSHERVFLSWPSGGLMGTPRKASRNTSTA